MNSSDIIDNSADEINMKTNEHLFDCTVEESFEGMVEESPIADTNDNNHILTKSNISDSEDDYELVDGTAKNNSFSRHRSAKPVDSEDDDESSVTSQGSFAQKKISLRGIRKIASDSEDDYEQVDTTATNNSFSRHRSAKLLDSEEDDDEHSVTSQESFVQKKTLRGIRKIASDSEDDYEQTDATTANNSINSHSAKPLDSEKNDDEYSVTSRENFAHEKEISKTINSLECNKYNNNESNFNIHNVSSNHTKAIEIIDNDDDTNVEIVNLSDDNVIQVSTDDEHNSETSVNMKAKKKLQQSTLDSIIKNTVVAGDGDNSLFCTAAEYANQTSKVSNLRTDILKCKNILRTANLLLLPDKGALLIERQKNLETKLSVEEGTLKRMVVNHKQEKNPQKTTWEQLQSHSEYVIPNTFGKQAMDTFATQKSLTMDRLKNLHDSLATCPDENTHADDPKGLRVELMPHQKRALAWLMWREGQKPQGGILADDMGLGKTLTMISLILGTKEIELEDNDSESESEEKPNKWIEKFSKVTGGTLVICPATLIKQWEGEIESKIKRNLLTCEMYHGNRRENRVSRLAKYDIVITTYKLVQGEFEKKGPLYKIKWNRIILDEGHVIRNPKAQTSVAACALKAKARWILTGTPVHNKELDLYALLKFLRCSPFDDITIWKRWVANKNAGGQDRLNTVVTSILLRRTKAQLHSQGALEGLPEKKFELIEVSLDSAEKKVYQKVLIFSRTLFIEFLRQKADRNPEFTNIKGCDLTQTNDAEYNKMHKKIVQMHGNTEVKAHEILVLLLRLRQICCHPSLVVSMLDKEDCSADGIEEDGIDTDLMEKLNNLNLDDDNLAAPSNSDNLSAVASKILSSSNPVFAKDRVNEKLRIIQKIIQEKVLPNDDKIIIVSQWTSMLNIIMRHLKQVKIRCDLLDGSVPVPKRNGIVQDFNSLTSKNKVLLLSLTAGGVGLNLVGANHLLLVDLHWNPQLESQAQDRIYRVGQKKPVYIYKIVTLETIEEKIKALQNTKLNLASDLLSGVRTGVSSKLSMDDLKMLFGISK